MVVKEFYRQEALFRLIGRPHFSLEQSCKLAANHLFAQRCQAIRKQLAVQVVELMLHHTRQIAIHPFFVRSEVYVLITHTDASGATYRFVNAGQA